MATTTVTHAPLSVDSRDALTLKAYGAPFLIPDALRPDGSTVRPALIGYVYVAGETPAFGILEATSHLEANFPTFGPLNVTRPCDFHSILWFADVAQMRRVGVASLSAHTMGRACPFCAHEGQALTLLNQGIANG